MLPADEKYRPDNSGVLFGTTHRFVEVATKEQGDAVLCTGVTEVETWREVVGSLANETIAFVWLPTGEIIGGGSLHAQALPVFQRTRNEPLDFDARAGVFGNGPTFAFVQLAGPDPSPEMLPEVLSRAKEAIAKRRGQRKSQRKRDRKLVATRWTKKRGGK